MGCANGTICGLHLFHLTGCGISIYAFVLAFVFGMQRCFVSSVFWFSVLVVRVSLHKYNNHPQCQNRTRRGVFLRLLNICRVVRGLRNAPSATPSRSVPAPTPLRLFYGCLTVFGRRGDGAGSEGGRRGGNEKSDGRG